MTNGGGAAEEEDHENIGATTGDYWGAAREATSKIAGSAMDKGQGAGREAGKKPARDDSNNRAANEKPGTNSGMHRLC